MIVADTNLLAYLLIPGIRSEIAERILQEDQEWCAPLIWRSEFRNTLVKIVRAGIIDRDNAFRILAEAESMMHGCEFSVTSGEVLDLALASGCSAYDAEYVVLARELRAPLVTGDRELVDKFPETALTPEMFLVR